MIEMWIYIKIENKDKGYYDKVIVCTWERNLRIDLSTMQFSSSSIKTKNNQTHSKYANGYIYLELSYFLVDLLWYSFSLSIENGRK